MSIWIVYVRAGGEWRVFDKRYSRRQAYTLASVVRAGGYAAGVRKIMARLNRGQYEEICVITISREWNLSGDQAVL